MTTEEAKPDSTAAPKGAGTRATRLPIIIGAAIVVLGGVGAAAVMVRGRAHKKTANEKADEGPIGPPGPFDGCWEFAGGPTPIRVTLEGTGGGRFRGAFDTDRGIKGRVKGSSDGRQIQIHYRHRNFTGRIEGDSLVGEYMKKGKVESGSAVRCKPKAPGAAPAATPGGPAAPAAPPAPVTGPAARGK